MKSVKKRAQPRNRRREVFRFAEVNGKTVKAVELFNATDYHAVSINFQDKTCLQFSFEMAFTIRTEYTDWKSGEERIIRKWPLVRSQQ